MLIKASPIGAVEELSDMDALAKRFGLWRILAASNVGGTLHTGTTDETTLLTVLVPGGLLGPNGILRIWTLWTVEDTADDKILRGKFGGTTFFGRTLTTSTSLQQCCLIRNRNDPAVQVGGPEDGESFAAGGALVTGTIDTTLNQDIVLTGQLETAGDEITLEAYLVEYLARD